MRILAGDLATGLIRVRNVPADSGQAQCLLNSAGTITATVKYPLKDPATGEDIDFAEVIVPGKSFIALQNDDGTIINAGPIWSDSFNFDSGTQILRAAGLRSYYDYRFVIPALADANPADTPVGKTTAYTNTSLRTIAKRLVQQAHAWTGGSVPVVFEDDFAGTNERTYLGINAHNLGTVLKQLTEVEDGPDIDFRPRISEDGNHVEWLMVTGDPELKRPDRTTVSKNVLTNPSFETSSGTQDVRMNGARNPCIGGSTALLVGGRVTLSDGGTFVRATISDALAVHIAQLIAAWAPTTGMMPTSPDEIVTVQAEGRASAYPDLVLVLQFYDDGGAYLSGSQVIGTGTSVEASSFRPLAPLTATAPAGTAYARWMVGPFGTSPRAVGDTFDVRNVIIEKHPSPLPFFHGGSPADSDFTYAWAGTVGNSVSYARAPIPTGTTAGASVRWPSGGWAVRPGTKSLRVRSEWANRGSGYVDILGQTSLTAASASGETLTFFTTVRTDAERSDAPFIGVVYRVGSGPYAGVTATAPNIPGVHGLRLTASLPLGLTELYVRLYNGAPRGQPDVWFDDTFLSVGVYQGGYFDGSTPDTATDQYVWDAGVDSSSSTRTEVVPAPDHIWNTDVPIPSVRGLSISRDATALVTDSYQLGGRLVDSDADPISAKSYNSALVATGFRRMEAFTSRPTVTNISTLQGHANEETLRGVVPREEWSLEADKNVAPALGEYFVGDYATVILGDNGFIPKGNYRLRIVSIKASLDSQFVGIVGIPERS